MSFTEKGGTFCTIFLLVILSLTPLHQANESFVPTDISGLPNKIELTIPIDTSLEESKYQPIDMRVLFDSSCWAKNETEHSVRIAYGQGSDLTEIESQIYDLSHTDETHIDACSVVFLIPEEATGSESYYVLYSGQSTEPPKYPNHFQIKDTHYFYEPISGQLMDFDYYQLIEDDYIIYAIVQQGELLGNGMSNTLIKLLPEASEFKTKNAEQIASFYMSYSIDPSGTHTGSQWATDVEKSILVQGNLMVRMQIEGTSPNGNIKTNNIYTYYYSPLETKKIHINVQHDVLNTVEIKGTQEREGTYCSLSTIKARSGTIEDMNLGEILPNIHIFNEDGTIRSYDIPTNPDVHPADWLLSATDDEDLGSNAWFCMDDPSTGIVHGLVFDKHTGFLNGSDDGIQVKTSVNQHVKLPGLEADTGDVYAIRNAYENGNHDTTLSEDILVSFNVMYIASQTGGYELVDQESTIYQVLIKDRPIYRGNHTDQPDTEEVDRHTLTVLLHNAPSAPLGSLLAAATGKNISYLTVELYKQNDLTSSGSAQRLQLGEVNLELDGLSFSEKIQAVRAMFDLKNSTFFKSVRFPDLEAGTYLLKVYKENPMRGDERKYIGYSIVEVNEDMKTHLSCDKETAMNVEVVNQNNNGIEHVQVAIQLEDTCIADMMTDAEGFASLSLPLDRRTPMTLTGLYQGFSIFQEDVGFGVLDRWRTQKQSFEISLFDLDVNVIDTFGLAPAVNTNPIVTSDNMVEPENIQATLKNPGVYEFQDLFENTYHLKMSYKSFKINEVIELNSDTSKEIVFPAEFTVDIEVLNSYGLSIDKASYSMTRENTGPDLTLNLGRGSVIVPPGTYELEVKSDSEMIAGQDVEVKGDKSITIISNQGSMLHTLLTVLLLVGSIGCCVFLLRMKKKQFALHILITAIILLSIFQPWWMLHGESDGVTTQTMTLLYPAQIITLTSSSDIIGGEISEVPEAFTTILHVVTYLLLATALLLIASMILSKRFRKIKFILQILTVVFLLLSMVLFYVAMSEVTKVGIGGFSGSDSLSVTIPGQSNQIDISCSWGPSSGMFLIIIALVGGIFLVFQKKLFPLVHRLLPFIEFL